MCPKLDTHLSQKTPVIFDGRATRLTLSPLESSTYSIDSPNSTTRQSPSAANYGRTQVCDLVSSYQFSYFCNYILQTQSPYLSARVLHLLQISH
jgi:hypothetical protein